MTISTVTLPLGFSLSGINCGIKRYNNDLGLIYSDRDCMAQAMFTNNHVKGMHVIYDKTLLPASSVRAVIINSGQANTATGEQGRQNNLTMAQTVEQHLKLKSHTVLTASTGIIGEQLSIKKIVAGIPLLISKLKLETKNFVEAIQTTDKQSKVEHATVPLNRGTVKITGICKGSGMIHPNMATMLAFIMTDVKLNAKQTSQLLKNTVNQSFNMISIDGVTSTNDSAFLLANGASGVKLSNHQDTQQFQQALNDVCIRLAKKIVLDGEGAHKLIEVDVNGAQSDKAAIVIARGVSCDNLVKTAMHGGSPNWGRIICALGNYLNSDLSKNEPLTIWMQNKPVYMNGQPVNSDQLYVIEKLLHETEIFIRIDMAQGEGKATAWSSDLSQDYVKLNAEKFT